MRQTAAIAINAFMELLRQPVFLLILAASSCFSVFLSMVPYFAFGDDDRLVKESVLASMLLTGLFVSAICASSSLAREIRSGTVLAVLAKPVGRVRFLLAKYLGLAGALAVLTYANTVSALLAGRMAYTAYGEPDQRALLIYLGAVALAFLAGGFSNYFLHRPFVSDATLLTALLTTVAFAAIVQLPRPEGSMFEDHIGVDWRLARAAALILLAFLIFSALALACSTRLDLVATLSICSGVFLLGLVSDHFFGRMAEEGVWWAAVLYAAIPNWQLFWMPGALEPGKSIPWSYVGLVALYALLHLGALLALAAALFQDREPGRS